jgi:hypothetical protein
MQPNHQLAIFAAPEGGYAVGKGEQGVFTEAALSVLKSIGGWPDHEQFEQGLRSRLAETRGFRISGFVGGHPLGEKVIGRVPSTGVPLADSLLAFLSENDVTSDMFMPHFRKTVSDLGMPGLATAQGLHGIVPELCSLRDTHGTALLPYGLLQFLKRLASENRLSAPINDWLARNAANRTETLLEIAEKLRLEAEKKILVIDVTIDKSEKVDGYTPRLFDSNGKWVQGQQVRRIDVKGWPAFERSLKEFLVPFVADEVLSNVDIHFVVDMPLFDRPFHRIPAPGGGLIGEQAVIVLRPRMRFNDKHANMYKQWDECAAALWRKPLDQLRWIPIEAAKSVLPNGLDLCFTGFLSGQVDRRDRRDLLRRLVFQGAPCIFIPQPAPLGSGWEWDWKVLGGNLDDMLLELKTIDQLPVKFRNARSSCEDFAINAAIIWEDLIVRRNPKMQGPITE